MSASTSGMKMTGSVKAMNSTWSGRRSRLRSAENFFLTTDLFHLTAKEWAQLLDELDSLTIEERDRVINGRDDEYGRGYE